jgi:DNA modification methylase
MGSVRSGACEPLFCLMPTLLLGNCLEKLAEMPDCSIDAIITDPPYGLSFMGKKWDYDVPSVEDIWSRVPEGAEAWRPPAGLRWHQDTASNGGAD